MNTPRLNNQRYHFNGDLIDTIHKIEQHKPDTDQR